MPGALVTGAARGLGLAIARRLAARGLAVEVTDVDEAGARAAAAKIGKRAHASRLDVTDFEACRAAAAEIGERAGSLDVWVNNAGILVTGSAFEQQLSDQRAMLEVNAIGTYHGTRAALELMVPAGGGHVINIISLAGLATPPGEVAYAASKHAAIAYTLGTLADLRRAGIRGVQLSAVCPDGVWSEMIVDKLDDPAAAPSFSGKMLMPDEVAQRAVALLDRPRPVLTIPRWRGLIARLFDGFPRAGLRLLGPMLADAQRRQRRFRRRVDAGTWPPQG